MKKVFFTIFTIMMLPGAFAAVQYSRINSNEGAGIVMTADAGVVLNFIRSDGSNASYGPYPSGDNLFGYYVMDSKNNMISWASIDLNALVDGSINIGDFSAGDRIGFWAADSSGEYMDSMNRAGEKGTTRDSAYVEQNGSATTVTMGNIQANAWGAEKALSGINDGSNFIFVINTTDPSGKSPVGQPLPGVIASILLGGGVVGALRFRKKK